MAVISFVVPVYNAKDYVGECIESILNQTIQDVELILVDDGSDDGSDAICTLYAERDDRVKLIKQENQGVSVARNIGMKSASSEWIAFIDCDDWIDRDYVKKLMPYLDDNEIIFFKYKIHKNKKTKSVSLNKETVFFYEDDFRDILFDTIDTGIKNRNNLVSSVRGQIWSKVYNKKFLEVNDIVYDESLRRSQDVMFNVVAYSKAKKGCLVEECLYNYRIDDNSLCHAYNETQKTYLVLFMEALCKYTKKILGHMADELCENRKTLVFVSIVLIDYVHPENKKTYKQRKSEYLLLRNSDTFKKTLNHTNPIQFGVRKGILVWCVKHNMFFIMSILVKLEKKLLKA